MRRPYNVESFVDDYGRLGEARRVGPSNDGPVRCPRAELTATLSMEDFIVNYKPGATAEEITE